MADISELQSQLQKLRSARGAPERKVSVDSGGERREVEYRSDAELAAAIADLESQIAAQTRGRIHTVKICSSKGL